MMRALTLSAVLFAAISAMAPALAADTPWVLSREGIGRAKAGMDVDQMERFVHIKLGYNQYYNGGCSTLTTKDLEPLGISFMVEAKRLSRVNVDFYGTDPRPLTIKTDAGIGLGSTEQDVLKAYTTARVKPDPADPTWHTIIVEGPDGTNGLVFDTNGKTVKSMRGGAFPAIVNPRGCN